MSHVKRLFIRLGDVHECEHNVDVQLPRLQHELRDAHVRNSEVKFRDADEVRRGNEHIDPLDVRTVWELWARASQECSFADAVAGAISTELTVAENKSRQRTLEMTQFLRRDQRVLEDARSRVRLSAPLYAADKGRERGVGVKEELRLRI